jgi:putative transposase
MPKTFKYRIYPTKKQETLLKIQFETCRQVYNRTLELRKNAWVNEHKSISLYDSQKIMTQWATDIPEMENVYSQVLQQVQVRVDLAYKAFFRRCKAGENPGYPRFKGPDRYDSLTYPQSGYSLNPEKETIYLSKTGHVPIILHRPCPGKIKTCTVLKTASGKWFVCLVVEGTDPIKKRVPITGKMVGIDLGLKTYIQASDGFKVPRQRFFNAGAEHLAKAQRKLAVIDKKDLSRKSERLKAKKIRAHAYEKISNCRRDFCHKTVNELLDRYDFIVAEKLNTHSMLEQKKFSKSIADASWAQLIQILSYKAAEAGKTVVFVDPRNTTQMCSQCRSIVPKDLSVRTHSCPHCGLKMDRDLNASLNILRLGLESVKQSGPYGARART